MAANPLQDGSVCKRSLALTQNRRRVAQVDRYFMAFRRSRVSERHLQRADMQHHKGYLLADRQGPAYAEILLVRLFRRAGWRAFWVDTYYRRFRDGMPPESGKRQLPAEESRLYDKIVAANGGSRAGCWDIWAWKGGRHLFVEAKMGGHDRIRDSQVRWVRAATEGARVPRHSFCVAEWYLELDR